MTHFKSHLSPSHFKQHRTKQVSPCVEEDIEVCAQGANNLTTILLECGCNVLPHSLYVLLDTGEEDIAQRIRPKCAMTEEINQDNSFLCRAQTEPCW